VVLLITYLSLILGELVPKQLALRDPERIAVVVARPLSWLSRATGPVVGVLSTSSSLVLRLFGRHDPSDQSVTEEEVKAVVAEGATSGAIETEERHMIERVLRLADKPVRALMTPRPELEWIDRTASAGRCARRGSRVQASRASSSQTGASTSGRASWRRRTCWTSCWRARRSRSRARCASRRCCPDTLSALDALERMRGDPARHGAGARRIRQLRGGGHRLRPAGGDRGRARAPTQATRDAAGGAPP
jgi:putative hemolysin